jgi:CRISPR-associated protein Csm3
MSKHKLIKKIIIKGHVLAETGLMIGGSSNAMDIGGTDKTIIRNPLDKKPYIPGSSLKGKMRSLIEQSRGTISSDQGPTLDPSHVAARLFGYIKSRDKAVEDKQKAASKTQQPSRLIVRDGIMVNTDEFNETELLYTEVKAENSIDRITSEANPRFFERVPKGAKFKLNMTLNVFEEEENFLNYVYESLRLVQDDYLGGGGSRGNGQVRFEIDKIIERNQNYYANGDKNAEIELPIPSEFAPQK